MLEKGSGAIIKSPKAARRRRSGENITAAPARQAHFDAAHGGIDDKASQDCQPTSFPALGNASGPWFTSADPTRSVAGQPAYVPFASAAQQPYTTNPRCAPGSWQGPASNFAVNNIASSSPPPAPPLQPTVTYIGQHPHPPLPPVFIAGYSNAGLPPTGVCFQPPVPDTTGPIPHVYVPRFDGGPFSGVQVNLHPYYHFMPIMPPAPPSIPQAATVAPSFTVMTPKTYYVNGHTYYQPVVSPIAMGHAAYLGQPGYLMAPAPQQPPVMMNGQAFVPAGAVGGPAVAYGPRPMVQPGAPAPVFAGNASSNPPDVLGLGRTPHEEMLRQVQFAYKNQLFEPQDFKPSDDDPSRFYYVREVDGNWTQRNRYTIDQMACRWYVTDEGWFYAVRLPD